MKVKTFLKSSEYVLKYQNFDVPLKVSKDVKRVRQFEQELLRNYKHYLELLEQTIKGFSK